MKNKLAALFAIAAVFAASAASCGNDDPEDSTVPELPSLTTSAEEETEETTAEDESEKTTEASTEKKTKAEKTTEADSEKKTEAEEENKNAPDDSDPEPEPQPDPEPNPEPAPQDVKFGFESLHSDASEIIAALGEPLDVQTAPACFSNGADSKIYLYDGLTIECYVLNGLEKICCVTITNASYSVSSGITIGSSQADVEAAYGAGESAGAYTIYYNGSNELDIKYSNGSVAEIMFYTEV